MDSVEENSEREIEPRGLVEQSVEMIWRLGESGHKKRAEGAMVGIRMK